MTVKKTTRKKEIDEKTVSRFKKLIHEFETMNLKEYVTYLYSPGRIIFNNFIVGVARGFGLIVGMTVVVAIFVFVINKLGGIPIIGEIFQWIGGIIQTSQNGTTPIFK